MTTADVEVTRKARCEITRRYVDSSSLDVRVMHGVVHLGGVLRPLRGHPDVSVKHEMDVLTQVLHRLPGIREVIWEAEVQGA